MNEKHNIKVGDRFYLSKIVYSGDVHPRRAVIVLSDGVVGFCDNGTGHKALSFFPNAAILAKVTPKAKPGVLYRLRRHVLSPLYIGRENGRLAKSNQLGLPTHDVDYDPAVFEESGLWIGD